MREIGFERGTENGAAKFGAVFGEIDEKPQGALWPPIRARVNIRCNPSVMLAISADRRSKQIIGNQKIMQPCDNLLHKA